MGAAVEDMMHEAKLQRRLDEAVTRATDWLVEAVEIAGEDMYIPPADRINAVAILGTAVMKAAAKRVRAL